jgi:hypothetical protein
LKLRIQVFWAVTRSSRVTDYRRFERHAAVDRNGTQKTRKTKTKTKGKGKGKVNFTLKQNTKAQSGSRDIALLFL